MPDLQTRHRRAAARAGPDPVSPAPVGRGRRGTRHVERRGLALGPAAPGGGARPTAAPVTTARGWPSQVDKLLVEVVADGFTVIVAGTLDNPGLLAATYRWGPEVDAVFIVDPDDVLAVRTARADVGSPVLWAYRGPIVPALRTLLDLQHPRHPDAPRTAITPAEAPRLPPLGPRPLVIRTPAARHQGARARRLEPDRQRMG